MGSSPKIDEENRILINEIISLQKEVMEIEKIHYKSYDLDQAQKRNQKFKQIKENLLIQLEDMYDI